MMANIHNKIAFKRNLVPYLLELKQLTGIDVSGESLISVENTDKIRQEWLPLKKADKNKFIISFSEKTSERFKTFIANLSKANNSLVYIWTEKSNICGLYKVASIEAINFAFPFNLSPDGIVVFLTEDLSNRLLLDYYQDSDDQEMLEVEWQGKDWHSIAF
jgi:hypothetical protein